MDKVDVDCTACKEFRYHLDGSLWRCAHRITLAGGPPYSCAHFVRKETTVPDCAPREPEVGGMSFTEAPESKSRHITVENLATGTNFTWCEEFYMVVRHDGRSRMAVNLHTGRCFALPADTVVIPISCDVKWIRL